MFYQVIKSVIRSGQLKGEPARSKDAQGNPVYVYHVGLSIITSERIPAWEESGHFMTCEPQMVGTSIHRSIGTESLVDLLIKIPVRAVKEKFRGYSLAQAIMAMGDL